MRNIEHFWNEHAAWSQATFGTDRDRGPLGTLKHLEQEAREAQDAPTDILEYADCLLLILDAARRAGFNLHELIDAAWRKLAINRARKWPVLQNADDSINHER